MAKRKKKKPDLKQQQAQLRKAYVRKMIALAERVGAEDFRVLMTPDMMDCLVALRIRMDTVAADDIPVTVLQAVGARQDELFCAYEVALGESGPSVPLRDFLTLGQALYFFVTSESNLNVKTGRPLGEERRREVLRERLADFLDWTEERAEPYQRLNEILWYITLPFSELGSHLYWMTHQFTVEGVRLNNRFELHAERPERRRVRLDGIARSVFRVGWALPGAGPVWVAIDRFLFDDTREPGQEMLPVFVQSHALHRMTERLDGTDRNTQQFYLYISLQNAEVVKNQRGQWLIAYYFQQCKLGYLLVEPVENMLVIRTFLFVTMDSTPEGQALQEAVGLEAVDKKYLAIDRFRTFLLSDIGHHPDIKELFVQAGCQDLFNVEVDVPEPEGQWEMAELIRSYLDTPRATETSQVAQTVNQSTEVVA